MMFWKERQAGLLMRLKGLIELCMTLQVSRPQRLSGSKNKIVKSAVKKKSIAVKFFHLIEKT